MAEQKIELRKIRDFGEIINDTFVFIKQNFKPLTVAFLGIAGVFMLAAAIVNGVYESRMGNVLRDIFLQGSSPEVVTTSFYWTTYSLVIVLAWLNITAMKVVVIAYMKVYDIKNKEFPSMEEVWTEFKKYFFKVLIFVLPLIILYFFGLLLCFIPGIYLLVVLVPFEMLIMVEDLSFSEAFSRCFVLIKNHFWMSLGIYIVCYLIYTVCAAIVGGVVGIPGALISYFTTKDVGGTVGLVTSIFNVFSYLFYIIYLIAATLNYFNLAERNDGTGMLNRLDNLGKNQGEFTQNEEQY